MTGNGHSRLCCAAWALVALACSSSDPTRHLEVKSNGTEGQLWLSWYEDGSTPPPQIFGTLVRYDAYDAPCYTRVTNGDDLVEEDCEPTVRPSAGIELVEASCDDSACDVTPTHASGTQIFLTLTPSGERPMTLRVRVRRLDDGKEHADSFVIQRD